MPLSRGPGRMEKVGPSLPNLGLVSLEEYTSGMSAVIVTGNHSNIQQDLLAYGVAILPFV